MVKCQCSSLFHILTLNFLDSKAFCPVALFRWIIFARFTRKVHRFFSGCNVRNQVVNQPLLLLVHIPENNLLF